jgi:hypothetical protein
MKRQYSIVFAIGFCFCLLLIVGGCVIQIGDLPRAKYEKTIELQAPMESGSILVADTSYGSITVRGADTVDCSVLATIRVQAPSEQEAIEIAEKVKIELEPAGKTLTVRADKPQLKNRRSISISYQITVPTETNIDCANSYGSIECKDINGQIQADTSYGDVKCRNIISEELNASSSYGHIYIEYSDLAPAEIQADVNNSYGGIDFTAPPGFTGQVELSTSYGSVRTGLPITVQGKISNQRIKGTIGEGNGKLILETSYGSIRIR